MKILPLDRPKKLGVIGGCIFLFSILFKAAILPAITHQQVRRQLALKHGWQMRGLWGKLPFPLYMHFYMFNVTNPEQIALGEKPIVQEVGPFVYDEWHEKTNQIDHEEDDSVSYNFHETFYFNSKDSGALTGEEEIIVPNYFALVLANTIMIERPSAMPLISKAIDSIFKKPNSLFVRDKVKNILFDGMKIDCNVSDSAGNAVCREVHARYEEFRLKKESEFIYSLSLWGAFNNTDEKGRHRVYRGIKNIMDVGTVFEYDGKRNVSTWGDDHCDTFNGTDGTVFHPYFDSKGKDDLVVYNSGLCRSISCYYDSKINYHGFKLLRYTADLGVDPDNNPLHKCYCRTPGNCLKKGVFDLYKCVKAPLIVSNPHFYMADPYYLSMVDGLKPIKEKHMISVDLQTFAGAPLVAHTRVQTNIFLEPIQKFRLMKTFPDALLPMFWFDRIVILPDWVLRDIKMGLILLKVAKVFDYLMMIGGIGLCGYAGFLHYKSLSTNKLAEKVTKAPAELKSTMNIQPTVQPVRVPASVD